MFKILFLKECKEILKSITYYIFLACMILFFVTQMGDFKGVVKPREGQQNYGTKYSEDKDIIMNQTLQSLVQEFSENNYTTYPVGFYKEVKLNDEKQKRIFEIIEDITDIQGESLKKAIEENRYSQNSVNSLDGEIGTGSINSLDIVNRPNSINSLKAKDGLDFEKFLDYMKEVDDIVGSGSSYDANAMYRNASVPKTYEDALMEYEDIIYKDNVSGAYGRLFSDYMGIILGILPVFLAVTRVLKDKRSKASDVIFSKKASSIIIILSRYLAIITMILVALILISIVPTMQSMYSASSNGVEGDLFSFVKYIFGWLLPTVLVSVSVGFFFTELTSGPIAILIQGIWWFLSLFSGSSKLVGNVGFNLIPRFNTIGDYDIYNSIFNELVMNRLIYSFIGIVLIIFTIIIYNMKRRGELNINGKIFKNSKCKLEV